MSKVRKNYCGICGGMDWVFPLKVSLCSECAKDIFRKKSTYKIVGRQILGGFCDLHSKIKFNVSKFNMFVCKGCLDEIIFKNKRFKTQQAEFFNKIKKMGW